jgi:hypothetical protein
MEEKQQINYNIVNRGLEKMLPGKFSGEEVEKVKEVRKELTKDRSKNKRTIDAQKAIEKPYKCTYCGSLVPKGNYCDQCGKPQKK